MPVSLHLFHILNCPVFIAPVRGRHAVIGELLELCNVDIKEHRGLFSFSTINLF